MLNSIKKPKLLTFFSLLLCLIISFWVMAFFCTTKTAFAMPFYNLKPEKMVLRAEFFTSYSTSSQERKENISLASKALDNTFVDVGCEFSFNQTVGPRTEKRGYKVSKIIVGGEFVDGVGGGVCQVSSTLYNAVLLAGLKVIEFHPHSLPVSYVAPSFDAMVNSGSADLKFVNDTLNPILIRTYADQSTLKVEIYGQKLQEKFVRKSVITEEIPAPDMLIEYDETGQFPELLDGQSKVVKYGKIGYKSQGYILVMRNGKLVNMIKIRTDSYAPTRGKIIVGKANKTPLENSENGVDLTMQSHTA